jgi:branched-chain amino acid transport system permease protein
VFQHVENASVLVLLIVAVAVHTALLGLALFFFGPEGVRTQPLVSGRLDIAGQSVSAQVLVVLAGSAGLVGALAWFFGRTMAGKALRATAFNRTGAKLVGISTAGAGTLAFLLAALIGAISGILVAPITTVYYDTGFLIGLKGFIAAIVGGLVSYPLAALGAILIGLMESFAAFTWSFYKDVIVFTAIIPILLWRNFRSDHEEQEEEE